MTLALSVRIIRCFALMTPPDPGFPTRTTFAHKVGAVVPGRQRPQPNVSSWAETRHTPGLRARQASDIVRKREPPARARVANPDETVEDPPRMRTGLV